MLFSIKGKAPATPPKKIMVSGSEKVAKSAQARPNTSPVKRHTSSAIASPLAAASNISFAVNVSQCRSREGASDAASIFLAVLTTPEAEQ